MNLLLRSYLKMIRHLLLVLTVVFAIYYYFARGIVNVYILIFIMILNPILAIILQYFLHKKKLERMGFHSLNNESINVYQSKSINSKLDLDEIKNRLSRSTRFRKSTIVSTEDKITLKKGWSWNSTGEVINIILEKVNENNYDYFIESQPKNRRAMIDFATNKENILEIEKLLTDEVIF